MRNVPGYSLAGEVRVTGGISTFDAVASIPRAVVNGGTLGNSGTATWSLGNIWTAHSPECAVGQGNNSKTMPPTIAQQPATSMRFIRSRKTNTVDAKPNRTST